MAKLSKGTKKVQKDFQKKKLKVGKRADTANVTKVDVKAKKIVIRNNTGNIIVNTASSVSSTSELAALVPHIIKQIQHFSPSNRLQGIAELKVLLGRDESWVRQAIIDLHLNQIIPEILEHLLKDEEEVREAVIKLFEMFTHSLPTKAFITLIPLIIPFMCNGMSNVQKIIRKDNLRVLVMLLEKHLPLFHPYQNKLLSHILSIIQDRTLSLPVAATTTTKVSTGVTGTAWNRRSTGVLQRGNNTPKATQASVSSNALTAGKHVKQHTRSTTFFHALNALQLLLLLSNSNAMHVNQGNDDLSNIVDTFTSNHYQQYKRDIVSTSYSEDNSTDRQFKNIAVLMLSLPRVIQTSSTSSSGSHTAANIHQQVLERLVGIFGDLVGMEESVQSSHNLELLLQICSSIYHLVSSYTNKNNNNNNEQSLIAMHTKLVKIFEFFPFVSLEASMGKNTISQEPQKKKNKKVKIANDDEDDNEEEDKLLVNKVNVKLSEIALLYYKFHADRSIVKNVDNNNDDDNIVMQIENDETSRIPSALIAVQEKTVNYLFQVFNDTLEELENTSNDNINVISGSIVQLLLQLSSQRFSQLFTKQSVTVCLRYLEVLLRFLSLLSSDAAPSLFKRHFKTLTVAVLLCCEEVLEVFLSPVLAHQQAQLQRHSSWIFALWLEGSAVDARSNDKSDLIRMCALMLNVVELAFDMVIKYADYELAIKDKFQTNDATERSDELAHLLIHRWKSLTHKLIIVCGHHAVDSNDNSNISDSCAGDNIVTPYLLKEKLVELRDKYTDSRLFEPSMYSSLPADTQTDLLALTALFFDDNSIIYDGEHKHSTHFGAKINHLLTKNKL